MKYDKYELIAEQSLMYYEFQSEGPKGKIIKLVEYVETGEKGVYNLAFGDKDHLTGQLNDIIITNNGDSRKVLATVASTVYAFTNRYTNALIYVKGSSKARTRLYRMGIANNLPEILQCFDIYGFMDEVWYEFEKNVEYDAFLIKRKNSKFEYEKERHK